MRMVLRRRRLAGGPLELSTLLKRRRDASATEILHSFANRMDCILPSGFGPGSAQVCQESLVHTRERAPAEHDRPDRACGSIVGDAHITAMGVFLDGHFGNDGDAHAGANHAEDAAELSALEDDLRIDTGAVASGNGGVTETVAVAKK